MCESDPIPPPGGVVCIKSLSAQGLGFLPLPQIIDFTGVRIYFAEKPGLRGRAACLLPDAEPGGQQSGWGTRELASKREALPKSSSCFKDSKRRELDGQISLRCPASLGTDGRKHFPVRGSFCPVRSRRDWG